MPWIALNCQKNFFDTQRLANLFSVFDVSKDSVFIYQYIWHRAAAICWTLPLEIVTIQAAARLKHFPRIFHPCRVNLYFKNYKTRSRFKVLPQTEGNIFTLYLLSWLLMTWEWKKPGHRQLRLPLQICVVNKSHKNNPADTRRNNNNVIMTSKRRRDVV